MSDLYEILGVSKDASSDEIKEAFRSKSKKHHPDMPEGDNDKFVEIKMAYDVLHSSDRRKVYDETGRYEGEPSHKPTLKEYMNQVLIEMMNKAFNHPDMIMVDDVRYSNYKTIMQKMAKSNLSECSKQKDTIESYIKSTKIVIERLGKNRESQVMIDILKKRLIELESDFSHIRFIYIALKKLHKFVNRVEYTPDVKERVEKEVTYGNLRW